MKICYIAPTILSAHGAVDSNIIERAVSSAIEKSIIIPFKLGVLSAWIKFTKVSFILCLAIAITGYLLGVCGINKGYKLTVLSIVFYLLITMISYLNGWV